MRATDGKAADEAIEHEESEDEVAAEANGEADLSPQDAEAAAELAGAEPNPAEPQT